MGGPESKMECNLIISVVWSLPLERNMCGIKHAHKRVWKNKFEVFIPHYSYHSICHNMMIYRNVTTWIIFSEDFSVNWQIYNDKLSSLMLPGASELGRVTRMHHVLQQKWQRLSSWLSIACLFNFFESSGLCWKICQQANNQQTLTIIAILTWYEFQYFLPTQSHSATIEANPENGGWSGHSQNSKDSGDLDPTGLKMVCDT